MHTLYYVDLIAKRNIEAQSYKDMVNFAHLCVSLYIMSFFEPKKIYKEVTLSMEVCKGGCISVQEFPLNRDTSGARKMSRLIGCPHYLEHFNTVVNGNGIQV